MRNYTSRKLDEVLARHRAEDRASALIGISAAIVFGFVAGWAAQSAARIVGWL